MMADTMPSLTEQIDRALSDGKLRADAAENIRRILSGEESDSAARVIDELSQANRMGRTQMIAFIKRSHLALADCVGAPLAKSC